MEPLPSVTAYGDTGDSANSEMPSTEPDVFASDDLARPRRTRASPFTVRRVLIDDSSPDWSGSTGLVLV
jgi:hypothetical protein